jgi:hypothetical protein
MTSFSDIDRSPAAYSTGRSMAFSASVASASAERTAVVGLIIFSSVRGAMTLPFG